MYLTISFYTANTEKNEKKEWTDGPKVGREKLNEV